MINKFHLVFCSPLIQKLETATHDTVREGYMGARFVIMLGFDPGYIHAIRPQKSYAFVVMQVYLNLYHIHLVEYG